MLITNPYVRFEMIVESSQFNFSSSGNQSFADVSLFKKSNNDFFDFITLELNKFVLNSKIDTIDNIKDISQISFVSNTLSDGNCQFNDVYIYAIKINGSAKFYSLTLKFGDNGFYNINNHPKKIKVEYIYENNNSNEITIDNINSQSIEVDMRGDNVTRVNIYFLESYYPFRFAYLQEIIFGVIYEWNQNNIIDLIITEETPYICTTLPIGTAKLTLYSYDDKFSFISDTSVRDYITEDQKFLIVENIFDTESGKYENINFGTYFIDNINLEADHRVTFNLLTILSKLDKYKFMKTKMYDDRAEGTSNKAFYIISEIMNAAHISSDNFEIDENLKNKTLEGYIPVVSCREALQRVLFASNALLYDNRSDKLIIMEHYDSMNQNIISDRIFDPVVIVQDDSNAKIGYNYYYYSNDNSTQTITKIDTLDIVGVNNKTIIFQSPVNPNSVQINGNAQIIDSNVMYVEVSFPQSHSIDKYEISASTYKESAFSDETVLSTNYNIKKFYINDIKLFGTDIHDIIQNLANLNSLKITYKIEYLCTGQQAGKFTGFELAKPINFVTSDGKLFYTYDNKEFKVKKDSTLIYGWLQYQTIDLAHGMVAKAEIILME